MTDFWTLWCKIRSRLRCGGSISRLAAGRLRQQDVDTRMEINPGGHYADGAERLRKGLTYILA